MNEITLTELLNHEIIDFIDYGQDKMVLIIGLKDTFKFKQIDKHEWEKLREFCTHIYALSESKDLIENIGI